VEGSYEHGIEPSGSVKCSEVLELAAQLAAPQEGLISVKLVNYLLNYCTVWFYMGVKLGL
jgi:hypothetical protein